MNKNVTNFNKSGTHSKRPNLRIHVVEGAKTQTNGTENIFKEIIAESFSNHRNDMDIQVQEAFKTPNIHV
jgi:hypothetical protein